MKPKSLPAPGVFAIVVVQWQTPVTQETTQRFSFGCAPWVIRALKGRLVQDGSCHRQTIVAASSPGPARPLSTESFWELCGNTLAHAGHGERCVSRQLGVLFCRQVVGSSNSAALATRHYSE